jgi:hypothetical protein
MQLKDMHLSEGELRAFQDQELSASQSQRCEAHLASCQACQAKASAIQLRTQRISGQFSRLQPTPAPSSNSPLPAARLRLASQIEKEKQAMKPKTFLNIPRSAWVALGIVAVLAISLTFAPVRTLANSLLALFRVQQIRIVQVDPANLPEKLQSSSQLEYIMSNNVKVDQQGEEKEVASAAEASQLAGFTLRLPAGLEGKQTFLVQPKANLSFTINLELVRGVLKDIERTDIQLPDNLDGAVVSMEIPTGVIAQYGDCSYDKQTPQVDPDAAPEVKINLENCIALAQIPSPQLSAPSYIDFSKIGEAYLQVLGMSQQEAASFASSVDWTTTFVMPLPRYNADYEQVDINGIPATLVLQNWGGDDHFTLLWVQDGIIYGLSGPGDKSAALKLAKTIQ